MSPQIKAWEASGEYITYGPFKHKLFVKQLGDPHAAAHKTLLLIHGFPESSYSYHAILEGMLHTFDRIILFDMLGYGLSDKPTDHYAYSLFEQADTVFAVWKHFNIKGGHILAHDMGVSVTTEILARHENGLMPVWFSSGIQSLTFTNGSMVLALANLRTMQKLLLSKYGYLLQNFTTFRVFNQQVRSAHGNNHLSDTEIQALWELNGLKNGRAITYLTIQYLSDRKRFEKSRWLPALAQTRLPIHLCWGDDDAVARVEMVHYLKANVCKNATVTIMKGLGHFCQLDNPDKWVEYVTAFYKQLIFKHIDT